MAPANNFVRVFMPPEYVSQSTFAKYSPITCPWEGGSALASDKKTYVTRAVTRKEYMEHGSSICSAKFDTPKDLQESGKAPDNGEEMY